MNQRVVKFDELYFKLFNYGLQVFKDGKFYISVEDIDDLLKNEIRVYEVDNLYDLQAGIEYDK